MLGAKLMIVYSSTKTKFQEDVLTNDIANVINNAFKKATRCYSWEVREKLPGKTQCSIWIACWPTMIFQEMQVSLSSIIFRQSNKRIDFILTGKDSQHRETAILVELKQWQHALLTTKDAIVITQVSTRGDRNTTSIVPSMVIQTSFGRFQPDCARREYSALSMCISS